MWDFPRAGWICRASSIRFYEVFTQRCSRRAIPRRWCRKATKKKRLKRRKIRRGEAKAKKPTKTKRGRRGKEERRRREACRARETWEGMGSGTAPLRTQ